MSIGKSALKRVENSGYSKVKTEAPDMLNSHVIAAPAEEVAEKLIAPIEEKKTAKKTTKKTTKKACSPTKKNGFIAFSIGEELPYYLR
jgi:hypothetical protein